MTTKTPWLVPGPNVYLEVFMLGTIISAFACGVVLSLSISCFRLVYKKFCQKSGLEPKRIHFLLLGYITIMTSISVFHLIVDVFYVTKSIFTTQGNDTVLFLVGANSVCTTLAIWGADGFLLWRVLRLYADLSGRRRAGFIVFLVVLSFASLVVGILMLFSSSPIPGIEMALFSRIGLVNLSYPGLAIITILGNLIFATLIVVRIMNYQRVISKLLGKEYGSPYTRIMSICVEACALITITYLVFLLLMFLYPFASWIPRILTVHVSVFSPILIIKRVAQGNDAVALVVESMNIPMTLTDAELEQARSGQPTTI